ncbi:hypothetical protein B9Z19DRAFT_1127047 [Tuber borchii]|uniref:MARVEL domain-containing protein n=1 Tax=Tuber borchii TaxID=42251 RepID=A0A2T6ZRZ3_TUBBO|nr:hypothetical protein B9Z19DRAFT_1127047 [Tuber borchii]
MPASLCPSGDSRWTGLGIFPVRLMLFVFIIAAISVSAVEIVATININAITALVLGLITLVHTIVDIALFFNSKLKPVYVVAMSSIMFSFWLSFSVWEVVEMVYMGHDRRSGSYYGSYQCSIVDMKDYHSNSPGDWSCPLPKARFSFSWILVLLYIASIVYSAQALKKEKKDTFQRQVDQAVAAMQAIRPPIMGCPQCGVQMLAHQFFTELPSPQYVQGNPAADSEKVNNDPAKNYIFP